MRRADEAGAVGVIMVNHTAGEAPFVMAHNGLEPRPDIPGYMVSLEDGAVIDDHDGEPATLEALGVYADGRRHEPHGRLQQLGDQPRATC